jgi:hypothetical protein
MNPKILHVLEAVFSKYRKEAKVQENPEACLLSLLETVNERLERISSALGSTVESASYDSSIEEAKKKLEEV